VVTRRLFVLCSLFLFGVAPAFSVVPKKDRPRVIVAPFPVAKGAYEGWGGWGYGYVGGETRISDVLQDLCVTTLIEEGSDKVRVMDRTRLNEVLAEQKLNSSGLVQESDDPAEAAKVAKMGKLLGVRWMITGKVTRFAYKKSGFDMGWGAGALVGKLTGSGMAGAVAGDVHVGKATLTGRLDMKLIDVQTAEIVAVAHDENTVKDMGVKVAGTGSQLQFDQTMVNTLFEPVIQKLSKQMIKKITVAQADQDD
jgi:curli biogenesis system outer membrane secretion channel CsgG